ncbi:MAG: hypothetical protein AAF078_04145 [Planctomycetota bacterium]
MQLQQAIQLVQQKFAAETQDKTEGPEVDAYHEAFEKYPAMMEIATQVIGVQIIQQNIVRQVQAKQQAEGGEGGADAGVEGVGPLGPITGDMTPQGKPS